MRALRPQVTRAHDDPPLAAGPPLAQLYEALAVTTLFASVAYLLGAIGRGGALGGLAVGTIIYACLDWTGFAVLALFVAGGSVLTRLGYAAKRSRGTAQSAGGRRGARNALANCGVAVACALAAALTPFYEPFAAAFAASLGAAFADTAESEVGQLSSRRPRLLIGFRSVPPGTDGAVSTSGTLAGVLAAGATAMLALMLGLVDGSAAAVVWVSAFLGTVVDSLVGRAAPRLGNEITNVLCTLGAAALALAFA